MIRNGVPFEEVSIESSEEVSSYLVTKGYKSAPIVEVYEDSTLVDSWTGFHPDKLNQL